MILYALPGVKTQIFLSGKKNNIIWRSNRKMAVVSLGITVRFSLTGYQKSLVFIKIKRSNEKNCIIAYDANAL
jgi:hypothetical protein